MRTPRCGHGFSISSRQSLEEVNFRKDGDLKMVRYRQVVAIQRWLLEQFWLHSKTVKNQTLQTQKFKETSFITSDIKKQKATSQIIYFNLFNIKTTQSFPYIFLVFYSFKGTIGPRYLRTFSLRFAYSLWQKWSKMIKFQSKIAFFICEFKIRCPK